MGLWQAVTWVRQNMLPKGHKFFDMFEAQTETAVSFGPLLAEIREATEINPACEQRADDIEDEGDKQTAVILDSLRESFIVPFDHDDINKLSRKIEAIMDLAEEAIRKMVWYELLPDERLKEMLEMVEKSLVLIHQAIPRLREKNGMRFDDFREEIRDLENNGDQLVQQVIADSYKVDVKDILKDYSNHQIIAEMIQKVMDFYMLARKRREIAEVLEETIDAGREVFTILDEIAAKNT
ncbi:MAG: DUF47 family protein [Patescibacteria group bacterium]